ncbi:MAG: phosphatase PAP2 family protein [Bacteroidaceae bacterium]|nr:phosphatase PAP2 family protein [Bacteroidaceae bacterium]MBR4065126.1 phosphatase PAP2 family protein [Bacteroidaceae bacterium]
MDFFDTLIEIDKYLLLSLNGSDSLFWDGVMKVYTSMAVWIPLALVLLYVLVKNNNIKDFLLLLLFIALIITITDTISSTICKPYFERWRPTRDPVLMYIVDVVGGVRGKDYGFTSSHASNSFGIAVFVLMLIKNRALSVSLILWASINAYTRIYLGVHYPGDILAGTLIGVLTGLGMYRLYIFTKKKMQHGVRRDWISNQYTSSGYQMSDVYLILITLFGTFAAIPVISFLNFVY